MVSLAMIVSFLTGYCIGAFIVSHARINISESVRKNPASQHQPFWSFIDVAFTEGLTVQDYIRQAEIQLGGRLPDNYLISVGL